jgi:hypothetical protein
MIGHPQGGWILPTRRPAQASAQKNSRAKALPLDLNLILNPRPLTFAISAYQRGGSVDFAPLDHPPKTWTAFPDT